MVHHLRKAQRGPRLAVDPRAWIEKTHGSQALLAHVENIWGLEHEEEGYVFATVARSHEGKIIRLTKTPESGFPRDEEGRTDFPQAQQKAWETLPTEFTWSEAIGFGIQNSTLDRTIRRARANGLLLQDVETKKYRKVVGETDS